MVKLESNLSYWMGRVDLNNIIDSVKKYSEVINQYLNEYVPEAAVPENKIYEAMRYSLLAGGKRIRPVLTLAVNQLFDGDMNEAIPFACAIEMIHTYSLIHDDLPAMDNDDYRRGRLTNHKVFGEGIAVLAGDALLNKAFEIMINVLRDGHNLERKVRAIYEIANASGVEGMIGGQVVDLESEGKFVDQETLRYMHSRKTGRLMVASAVAGAITAGAGEEDVNKIRSYASNLGLAFQIKDDILSEIGEQEKLGKRVGNDREKNKSTYVTTLGLDEAKRMLDAATKSSIESLESYKERAKFLIGLAEFLLYREN